MSNLEPQSPLSTLNYLEHLFKKQLGLYLLLTKSNDLTLKIKIEFEPIYLDLSLHCKINQKTANHINYYYNFTIDNRSLSFVEFYHYLLSTYQDHIDKEKYPNFIETLILPKLFDEIKKNPQISSEIHQLRIYDSGHSNKFKEYESESLRKMISMGKTLKLDITREIYDLSKKTVEIFKFLLDGYENPFDIYIVLDNHLDSKERKFIFELYYKRIVCDNLFQVYKGYNQRVLGFDWRRYRNPFFPLSQYYLSDAITYSINMSFGDYLPYFFMNDKILFDKYTKAITQPKVSKPQLYTPYSISKPNNYSFQNLGKDAKKYLFEIPYGSRKQINSITRFHKAYVTSGIQEKTKLYEKVLKTIKTYPRVFFHSDTFGIISLEIPSQKSLEGNRITLRFFIYNLSTTDVSEGLFHYYRSFKMDKEKDKFFSILKQGTAIFEKLFNFYPFHPFFFNRMNYHMLLYSAKIYNIDAIHPDFRLGYDVDPLLDDLFSQMEYPNTINLDIVLASHDSIKTKLINKVVDSFYENAYLWSITYIEKYFYLVALLVNKLPKIQRYFESITDPFPSFINEIEDKLKAEVKGIEEFKLIVQLPNVEDNLIDDIYFPRTFGLYYCLNYNNDNRRLRIFKLNSVSFNDIELYLIKKEFKKDPKLSLLRIKQTHQQNNLMKELIIENLSYDQFVKINNILYKSYPEFIKLHSLDDLHHNVIKFQEGKL